MATVGTERILTQKHVIRLFKDELGFGYLGHWNDRPDNGNVEEASEHRKPNL